VDVDVNVAHAVQKRDNAVNVDVSVARLIPRKPVVEVGGVVV